MELDYCIDELSSRSQHDDPRATMELFGSWCWASLEFQVEGKDGATEPSKVVETPEQKITLKHLLGGAPSSDFEVLSGSGLVQPASISVQKLFCQ